MVPPKIKKKKHVILRNKKILLTLIRIIFNDIEEANYNDNIVVCFTDGVYIFSFTVSSS